MTRLLVLSSHSSHFHHKFKVFLRYHSSKLHRDKVKFCPICHNFSNLQQNTPHGFCCCCSVAKSCPTLCDAMDCSTPGFPALHHLPEVAQTHVHWACDAIQPSYPLSSPSSPDFNLSQHQSLFQWVISHWVYEWINKQIDEKMPTEDMKYNLYFTFWVASQKNSNPAQRVTSWKRFRKRGRKGSWNSRLSLQTKNSPCTGLSESLRCGFLSWQWLPHSTWEGWRLWGQ